MRVILLSLLAIAACATDDSAGPGPGPGPDPDGAWVIDTPSFTLQPGEEKFYCFYTTTQNTEAIGLARMSSHMPAGSHHMIVFKTKKPIAADGMLRECNGFPQEITDITDIPIWLYASQEPDGELVMPDGVGMQVGAAQHLVVNMHYINTTDAPLTATVHLALVPIAAKAYTEAHTFVTYNTQINVPANQTGSAGGTCAVPAGAQFITMSTHSHKYTTSARVTDGDKMVLETRDWAHATLMKWPSPYFTFASNKLTYQCNYTNTTSTPITTGESALANEMCMAVGVLFPATKDTFCLNSSVF